MVSVNLNTCKGKFSCCHLGIQALNFVMPIKSGNKLK